ncbi:MAG: hypothetical protein IK129_07125 [Deltaproteobacteria bacterium]|nr:hypothetical protein [Deltaproteobacteria bacterium]
MADERDYGFPQIGDTVEILKELKNQGSDVEGAPEVFPKGTRAGVLEVYEDEKVCTIEIYDQEDFRYCNWYSHHDLPFSDVKIVFRP